MNHGSWLINSRWTVFEFDHDFGQHVQHKLTCYRTGILKNKQFGMKPKDGTSNTQFNFICITV